MEKNFSLDIQQGIQQKLHYFVCSQICCMQQIRESCLPDLIGSLNSFSNSNNNNTLIVIVIYTFDTIDHYILRKYIYCNWWNISKLVQILPVQPKAVCRHWWCCVSTIPTQIWCPIGICFRSCVIVNIDAPPKSDNQIPQHGFAYICWWHTNILFFNVKCTNDANNALSLMAQCVEDVRVWMT